MSGQNNRLTGDNTLRDILVLYGLKGDPAVHKIVLFVRRALLDDSVVGTTKLSWFLETPVVSEEQSNA